MKTPGTETNMWVIYWEHSCSGAALNSGSKEASANTHTHTHTAFQGWASVCWRGGEDVQRVQTPVPAVAAADSPSQPCVTEQKTGSRGTEMLAGVRGLLVTHFWLSTPSMRKTWLLQWRAPWEITQWQAHLTPKLLVNSCFWGSRALEVGGSIQILILVCWYRYWNNTSATESIRHF